MFSITFTITKWSFILKINEKKWIFSKNSVLTLVVKIKDHSVTVNAGENRVKKKNSRTEQKFKIYDDKG